MLELMLLSAIDVKVGGTFYTYMFFWQNSFVSDASDNHFYVHGDISTTIKAKDDIVLYTSIGVWGPFGKHPISGAGVEGFRDAHLLQGYLKVKDFLGLPLSFKLGKQRLLHNNGLVLFDGGEDGVWGLNVSYEKSPLNLQMFAYRLEEGAGTAYIGTGQDDSIKLDMNLYGLNMNKGLGKVNLDLLIAAREYGNQLPIWLYLGSSGNPLEHLNYFAGLAYLTGKMGKDTTVSAFAFELGASYDVGFGKLGFGAIGFSGGEVDTAGGKVVLKTYESALNGPYTYGFYKWWVGLGPAHTLRTPYGFALVGFNSILQNSLNLDLYYSKSLNTSTGPVTLRMDLWKYDKFYVASGSKDMGFEVSFLLTHTYKETFTYGLSIGYWKPGDALGTNLKDQIGGYVFLYSSF